MLTSASFLKGGYEKVGEFLYFNKNLKKRVENKENRNDKRGWEVLEIMLRERGVTEVEIEEAKDSFYKGIEILSRMFLSQYLSERKKEKI